MSPNNLEKLQRISGHVSVLILIIMVLMALAIVISLILLVLCYIDGSWFSEVMSLLEEEALAGFEASMVVGVIDSLFVLAMLWLMYKMFSDIKSSYTPFKNENVTRLKHVAYILLVYSIALPIIGAIAEELSGDPLLVVIEFNFVLVAVAVLFYCMSLVFAYGTNLQKESDETL